MEVSSLGNFTAAQKQTTDASSSDASKSARAGSTEPQGTTTEEAQSSPIPPVNQSSELGGEEGNSVTQESGSGNAVDLLA